MSIGNGVCDSNVVSARKPDVAEGRAVNEKWERRITSGLFN